MNRDLHGIARGPDNDVRFAIIFSARDTLAPEHLVRDGNETGWKGEMAPCRGSVEQFAKRSHRDLQNRAFFGAGFF